MKRLLIALFILVGLSASAQLTYEYHSAIVATNVFVTQQYPFNPTGSIIGPPYNPEVILIPGYERIVSPDIPSIYLNSVGYAPNWGQGGVGIYFSAPLTNGVVDSSQRGLHISDNLFVNGGVYSIYSYQTNVVVVWATNSYYAVIATNTPDGQPIPYLAGTNNWTGTNVFGVGKLFGDGTGLSNVLNARYATIATNTPDSQHIPWLAGTNNWTGTNTFTHTLNIWSNITVLGASGGTSNVPIGGMTFHFVNGFFSGASVP